MLPDICATFPRVVTKWGERVEVTGTLACPEVARLCLLAEDAEHGDANKAVMQGWLDTHTPAAVEAARQLQPVWSQVTEKVVKFEDSYQRASARFAELQGELGLNVPQGA